MVVEGREEVRLEHSEACDSRVRDRSVQKSSKIKKCNEKSDQRGTE